MEKTTELFKSYANLFFNLGYTCTGFEDLRVVNIVARYTHHSEINLFNLATWTNLEYDPDIFPAVRFRLDDLKITINIFRTGKCVILGAKNLVNLNTAETKLKNLLTILEWST